MPVAGPCVLLSWVSCAIRWQLIYIRASDVDIGGTSCANNTPSVLGEADDRSLSLSALWPAPGNPQQATDDPSQLSSCLYAREYTDAVMAKWMWGNMKRISCVPNCILPYVNLNAILHHFLVVCLLFFFFKPPLPPSRTFVTANCKQTEKTAEHI